MVQVLLTAAFALQGVTPNPPADPSQAHPEPSPTPFPIQFAKSITGRTVTICLDGRQVKTSFAGKLIVRDQHRAVGSYCANVRKPVAPGQVFSVRPHSTSAFGGNVRLAGNIVARWFSAAQTADQCAGLQLAVWEAIEDGGVRPNFAAGRFKAKGSPDAMAFAERFYAAVQEPGDSLYLQAGDGGGSGQSQITTRL